MGYIGILGFRVWGLGLEVSGSFLGVCHHVFGMFHRVRGGPML